MRNPRSRRLSLGATWGWWIFGAGDDAKPLLRLARELGWFVAVADGRRHLATSERFAAADKVLTLAIATLPESGSLLAVDDEVDRCRGPAHPQF